MESGGNFEDYIRSCLSRITFFSKSNIKATCVLSLSLEKIVSVSVGFLNFQMQNIFCVVNKPQTNSRVQSSTPQRETNQDMHSHHIHMWGAPRLCVVIMMYLTNSSSNITYTTKNFEELSS